MLITSLHSNSLLKHFANVQSIINQMKAKLAVASSYCLHDKLPRTISDDNRPFPSLAETFFIIKLPQCEWLANKRFVYIERPRCSNFPLFYIPSAHLVHWKGTADRGISITVSGQKKWKYFRFQFAPASSVSLQFPQMHQQVALMPKVTSAYLHHSIALQISEVPRCSLVWSNDTFADVNYPKR